MQATLIGVRGEYWYPLISNKWKQRSEKLCYYISSMDFVVLRDDVLLKFEIEFEQGS